MTICKVASSLDLRRGKRSSAKYLYKGMPSERERGNAMMGGVLGRVSARIEVMVLPHGNSV